jgi:hypothetical protein
MSILTNQTKRSGSSERELEYTNIRETRNLQKPQREMLARFESNKEPKNSSIPAPIAGPSTSSSYGGAAPKKRIAHVPKAKGLLTALTKPDAVKQATVEHGLPSDSHNFKKNTQPQPSSSELKAVLLYG